MDYNVPVLKLLKSYFGYDSLLPLQEEIIGNVLSPQGYSGLDAHWRRKIPVLSAARSLL